MWNLCFFSVVGLTFIKIGSDQPMNNSFEIPVVNISISIWSFIGIACYGISFLIYLGVISKFDLGFIIPIIGGIVNILILIISYFILKEQLTFNMVLGAIITIIGIVIMNINTLQK